MKKIISRVLALLVAALIIMPQLYTVSSAEEGKWIAAWGTGTTEIGVGGYEQIGVIVTNVTCRSVIVPTASGTKLRLRLSNVYGNSPLNIQHITVADTAYDSENREYGSRIDASTCTDVTFSGQKSVSIPAGEEIVSDPVDFKVTALKPVSVSLYVLRPNEIRCAGFSGGYSYLTTGLGDLSDNAIFGLASIKMSYGLISVVPAISSMDVLSTSDSAYSVVVIGDSTVSNDFPLQLARSLNDMGYDSIGIVGKGIIGNSLLSDGIGIGSCIYGNSLLSRFDVDALSQSGVKYVVVKIGCNDIVHPKSGDNEEKYGAVQPTAEQLEKGFTVLAEKCHAAGIKMIMAQLGPWKGYTRDFFGTGPKYEWSAEDWSIACEVNEWIKTTDVFDGVVDLNTCCATEDGTAIQAKYTKDGAHPDDELQQLWGDIFPVELIGAEPKVRRIELDNVLVTISKGGFFDVNETVFPENSTDKSVVWSSLDDEVATVDKNGVIEGKKTGITAITCQSASRDVKARCIVCVCDLTLSKTKISLAEGQKYTASPVFAPAALKVDSVTWSTSDSSIATVSDSGVITAKAPGICKITCIRNDSGVKAVCTVTVTKKISVESVKLNYTKKSVAQGQTFTLVPTVNPSNATDKSVKYSSSDKSIAAVSSKGLVKGKSKGTCKITCTTVDGKKTAVCTVRVTDPQPSSVKLNKTSLTLNGSEGTTIKATVSPSNAVNKDVRWSSSDKSVAVVSSKGYVKGVGSGTCKITCTTVSGKKTAVCTVKVNRVLVQSVKLSEKSMTLDRGDKIALKAVITPSNASDKVVKWSSSNTKAATVSQSGVVTAVNPGTAVISCKTDDGNLVAKCTVKVKGVHVSSVKLNKTSIRLKKGETYQLKQTVSPSDADNKKVTWTSGNTAVAKVSSTGKVTAIKKGSAKITVKTADGAYKAVCTVTVS